MPENKSVGTALSAIKTDKSKILGLTVGTHKDVTPGQQIPKADAQSAPTLSFPTPSSTGAYLVIGLDIDAPFPSFGVLGPILHWIQPGLKPSADGTLSSSGTPFVADYIGPAPPPPSGPHRYTFFLYEQPEGFNVEKYAPPGGQKLGNWKRIRYDLGAFEKEAKLGPVVAANYFNSN